MRGGLVTCHSSLVTVLQLPARQILGEFQNRLVVASTHTGAQPRALALTPDERFLVAVDSAASSLAVLRTDRPALVTTIPVGTRPVDVVVPDWLK